MTAERQERKQWGARIAAFAGLFAVMLLAGPSGSLANPTETIVVDWHTGLAIDGYDPVAFYTDRKPMRGSADFELRYGGVVWRFCNIGNRAAFAARPDIYMPQFGGYDPLGVARGVAVAGNPTVWLINGERLFLFYDNARLETFRADAARLTVTAERRWPQVRNTLSP